MKLPFQRPATACRMALPGRVRSDHRGTPKPRAMHQHPPREAGVVGKATRWIGSMARNRRPTPRHLFSFTRLDAARRCVAVAATAQAAKSRENPEIVAPAWGLASRAMPP